MYLKDYRRTTTRPDQSAGHIERSARTLSPVSRTTATAILALCLVVSACSTDSFSGSLEAVIDPARETTGFGNFSDGSDKSFGIFVCSKGGAVELVSIEPIALDGDIEFLGAMIYKSPDMFVGAADGYPTDGLDPALLESQEGQSLRQTATIRKATIECS